MVFIMAWEVTLNQSEPSSRAVFFCCQVQYRRFHDWSDQLKMPARALNHFFLEAMAGACAPLEGAIDLLNAHGVIAPEGIVPTYEVSCLKELQGLLLK